MNVRDQFYFFIFFNKDTCLQVPFHFSSDTYSHIQEIVKHSFFILDTFFKSQTEKEVRQPE